MADAIVSCPGCSKKWKIPDGATSGSFACTACGADVAYGAAKKAAGGAGRSTAAGGGRKKAGRAARGGRGSGGGRKKPARGGGRGRRGAPEPEEEEGGRRRGGRAKKENTTVPLVIGIMGIVLLIGILAVAFLGGDDKEQDSAASTGNTSADPIGAIGSGNGTTPPEVVPDTPTPEPTTTVEPTASGLGGTDEEKEPESGIGGTDAGYNEHDYGYWFKQSDDDIFTEIAPLEGTTSSEIEEMTRWAAAFGDPDSGGEGMDGERDLEKMGKKAFPFVLNEHIKRYRGEKWVSMDAQISCYQIQKWCRRVIKATKFPSSFTAVWNRGGGVPPEHFQRAAKMWICWWKGEGQHLEEFTPFPDEE